jgi:hypothetical protein
MSAAAPAPSAGAPGPTAGEPARTANCGQFSDVAATDPACGAILKLAARGVVNGYPDGTFRPQNPVTRAEFAKMAVLAFDRTPDPAGPLPFSDVAGHWAAVHGYLQTAVAMDAVNGFPDGTFRPNAPISRAQAVKVAASSLHLVPGGTGPYTDVPANAWYAGWVAVGHRARLIGTAAEFPVWTGTSFAGDTAATRAEAAMVLGNLPLTPAQAQQAISGRAAQAIAALKNQNMAALSALAHPALGVRFSPYTYVHVGTDLVFPASWLTGAFADSTVYTWGIHDGSGLPIQLTFSQYYAQFIYDHDYQNAPDVSYNVVWQRGNMINNTLEAYPGTAWVEYHFPGFDPQYGGMDWKSLRLVFAQQSNVWYLIGIIHDQWTI